jgi:hypothetical protein
MVLLFGELFGFLAELFFIGAATEESKRDKRRKEAALLVLDQAARLLDGSVHKPWFRKPRIKGDHQGRAVEVIWLGGDQVEVRCRADRSLDFSAKVRFLTRMFGSGEPVMSGGTPRLAGLASDVFRRYGGVSLAVRDGDLVARARPGLDVGRIYDLAASLVELAWAEAAPLTDAGAVESASAEIRVAVRAAGSSRPPPAGGGAEGLRCPFCHDDLEADKPVVHCDACDAPHHPSCFEEGEGCSIQGCQHRKARGVRT